MFCLWVTVSIKMPGCDWDLVEYLLSGLEINFLPHQLSVCIFLFGSFMAVLTKRFQHKSSQMIYRYAEGCRVFMSPYWTLLDSVTFRRLFMFISLLHFSHSFLFNPSHYNSETLNAFKNGKVCLLTCTSFIVLAHWCFIYDIFLPSAA